MFKYISLVLSTSLSLSALANDNLASHLTSLVDAKSIDRVSPVYPIEQAKRGRDGWVMVNFVVEPDGSTSNIVIEDSSGTKSFERSTIKAIKKWQYQPATENGQAVQQCKTRVRMDFSMRRKDGVTKKFRRLYNHFYQALEENNQPEVEELYQRIKKYKLYAGAEEQFRQSVIADYFLAKDDKLAALSALEKSEYFIGYSGLFKRLRKEKQGEQVSKKYRKPYQVANEQQAKKLLYPLLHRQLVLALDLQLVSKALNISDKLTLIAPQEKQALYQQQYDSLAQLIESEQHIVTPAVVGERDFWSYKLVRNTFSFTDIDGELDKMDIRCRNKRHVYTINDKSSWQLPDSWQGCSILVYGEQGATFNLVEQSYAKQAKLSEQSKSASL